MSSDFRNIGAILLDLARADPDKISVQFDGCRYSRGQIMANAATLNRFFQEQGVSRGQSVALLTTEPLRGVEAMIALWSLEAAVLFLDPRQTLDEIEQATESAGIDHVFSDGRSFAKRGGFGFVPPRDTSAMSFERLTFPSNSEDGDALILSTSGTTGLPRYRRRSHRMFLDGIYSSNRLLNVSHPKPAVILGSLAFGAVLGHWIKLLLHGQFLLGLPLFFRVEDLHEALSSSEIETVGLPPVLIRDLLDFHEGKETGVDGPLYPHIIRLSSVGGPLAPDDLVQAYKVLTPGVHNLYSMSGVGAVSNLGGEDVLKKPDSVGKPIPEVSVSILDDYDRPVPLGQIGRIFAKPDWSPDIPSVDSGDMGWMDEDGYLFIAGRAQQMATRNSVNVNLKHLEQDVKRLSDIRDCVAFSVQSDTTPDDHIFLAIETSTEPEQITKQLRSAIASYRRPDKILIMNHLPRNAANKILLGHLQKAAQDGRYGFVDF